MSGVVSAKTIVIKVGSRSLTESADRFSNIANQVAQLHSEGRTVIVVSSGAVALGRQTLGFEKKPKEMSVLQACAAVGQASLMRAWKDAFDPHQIAVGQILLTHFDLADRDRYLRAAQTLKALRALSVVPIVNENDTVAVEEIKFGDNDQLAAMVATLTSADLLILLSDVEGVLDADGKRVPLLQSLEEGLAHVGESASDIGTGGMDSKIRAAHRASLRGVPVAIADARQPNTILQLVRGEDVGTLIAPHGVKLRNRQHWIAFTLRPKGTLVVDDGAKTALSQGNRSLLPAGVVGVRGGFEAGDPISIVGLDGKEIGRGLSRYSTSEVARVAGLKANEIEGALGFHHGDEIVHRDDLVLT